MDLSPEEFRRLGHAAVDLIVDHFAAVVEGPARRPVPDAVRERLMRPPGDHPTAPDAILHEVEESVLAYPMGNANPRFFAWINPPPAPLAVIGDLLASGMGASVAGGDHAATYVEHGVLGWIKAVLGWPAESGGLLTSGGSVANLTGLAVMRHVKTNGRIRSGGFAGEPAPMVVYTSTEGHSSIQKAVELLGFGSDSLRLVPVDARQRMDTDALVRSVRADQAAGLRPVAVAASAGTVNSGAIDPLGVIADVCAEHDLWLHVDGSYGGFGILDDRLASLYEGLERADSVAVDPHKWLYMPPECGAVLVRDAAAMRAAFSLVPPYLRDDAELPWFSEFGIQQTRQFRALKLWMVLRHVGTEGYRRQIRHDIDLADRLAAAVSRAGDFELVAKGPLSAVCFRHTPEGVDDTETLNADLVPILQRNGEGFLTRSEIGGRVVLRACVIDFRTTEAHLDRLLDAIRAAAAEARRASP